MLAPVMGMELPKPGRISLHKMDHCLAQLKMTSRQLELLPIRLLA